jgi:hypothetical protein
MDGSQEKGYQEMPQGGLFDSSGDVQAKILPGL